jgi:dTDP-4-dehydrorhamnose reductase
MNILITGSNGQLGNEIKCLEGHYKNFNFFFCDRLTLDICNRNHVDAYVDKNKINVVINCAAYTAVDHAQKNKVLAERINVEGVENLVNAAKKVNGKLIHISTDYVFDGNNCLPYKETDEVNPIGVYANTKRKGELIVINSDIDAIVIRTSWLYSIYRNNFAKTVLSLGHEKDEFNVVFDQVGTPTHAFDLAKACLDILVLQKRTRLDSKGNIYHFSNEGVASWYDFAYSIIDLSKIHSHVNPVDTKYYPTPVKRPSYSVLNKTKIKTDFEIKISHWKYSLEVFLAKLKSQNLK